MFILSGVHCPLSIRSDLYGGDVKALLHFEGANGGTNFDDELGNVWTRRNSAVLTTANAMVGNTSLNCLNGIRSSITPGGLLDISGNGNYCIEVKFRAPVMAGLNQVLVCFNRTAFESPILRVQVASGQVNFQTIGVGDAGVNIYHPTSILANTVNTLCIQRRGADIYDVFVNGVIFSTSSYVGTNYSNSSHTHCYIGTDVFTWNGYQSNQAQGLVDEVRITKNFRYSASYTPETGPFVL